MIAAAIAGAVATLLVGCGADPSDPDASGDPQTSDNNKGDVSTTTEPTATTPFVLPDNCAGLLTLDALDAGLGTRIVGTTEYIVGAPEPGIGRTGRVTCSYGVTRSADGTSSAPLVQASVFTYDSAESALDRVETVVSQGRNAGNRVEDVSVGEYAGVLIVSVTDATLVFAVGERNYAITVAPGLVAETELAAAMASLGLSAVNGGTPPTADPTAPSGTPTSTS